MAMTDKYQTVSREDLTPKERRAWDEARTALLYEAPMWSHLLYTMMSGADQEQAIYARNLPGTAACDDKRVMIDLDKFCTRPLGERVFILAHEISHGMFAHSRQAHGMMKAGKVKYQDGKEHTYNDALMQDAADYFVNDMLVKSEIGTTPKDAMLDPRFTYKMSVVDIYRALMEEQEKQDQPPPPPQGGPGDGDGGGDGQGDQPGQNPGQGRGNFDQHLPPGTSDDVSPEQAAMDRDDEEWNTEIRAAADNAKAQGKLPGAMEEALSSALASDTDWRDRMRSLLARGVGTGSFDWQHPDRRMITRDDMIVAPGRRGFKCKLVIVVGDSSGSINEPTSSAFFAEMSTILDELEPEEMMFAWCDAKVHGWSSVDSFDGIEQVRRGGIKGRGGTDFRPPFKEIADMGLTPDAVIYLTDGYGPFPEEAPPYQVIWGDITNRPDAYPWGDTVHIPVKDYE